MTLTNRLRQIEKALKAKRVGTGSQPSYLSILDWPKDEVVEALSCIKEMTGGYECLFKNNGAVDADSAAIDALNQLSPGELYERIAEYADKS